MIYKISIIILIIETLLLGIISGSLIFPVFFLLLFFTVKISHIKKIINYFNDFYGIIFLILLFVLKWFVLPVETGNVRNGLFLFSMTYVFSQFFIVFQLLHLTRREFGFSNYFLIAAVMILVAEGNFFGNEFLFIIYQWSVIFITGLIIVYIMHRNYGNNNPAPFRNRMIPLAYNFIFVIILSLIFSYGIKTYANTLEKYYLMLFKFTGTEGSGFTGKVDLGNGPGRGAMDNDIVLRIYSDKTLSYLRGNTFLKFRENSWIEDKQRTSLRKGNKLKFLINEKFSKRYRTIKVFPQSVIQKYIFSPPEIKSLIAEVNSIIIDTSHDLRFFTDKIPDHYEIVMGEKKCPFIARRFNKSASKRYEWNLLELPEKFPVEFKKLADKIFSGCKTDKEKIDSLKNYFKTNFKYDLNASFNTGNKLREFLFEKKSAHCEYFASATTLLLRVAGIKTRMVTGFVVTEYNKTGKYFIIRNKDAHAWAEAYIDKSGWTIVDNTPAEGIPQTRDSGYFISILDNIIFNMIKAILFVKNEGISGILTVLADLFIWIYEILKEYLSHLIYFLVTIALLYFIFRNLKFRKKKIIDYNEYHEVLFIADKYLSKKEFFRNENETINNFALRIIEKDDDERLKEISQWYREYSNFRFNDTDSKKNIEELRNKIDRILSD